MFQPISKEWIKSLHRNTIEYMEGIKFFMEFAMEHAQPGRSTCICPCKKCRNFKRLPFSYVKLHLIQRGMDPSYDVWVWHGEKPGMNLKERPKVPVVEDEKIDKKKTEDENIEGEGYGETTGVPEPEKYKQNVGVEQKRKVTSVSDRSCSANGELVEIFAPKKKSRCHAVSYDSSMKSFIEEFRAEIKVCVQGVLESLGSLANVVSSMPHLYKPQLEVGTSKTEECTSNYVPHPNEKQEVMLLSLDRREVAQGYIVNHNNCHGKQVVEYEKVVFVTEVKDLEAQIYEAPQDGHYRLGEIADGGFIIWLQSRLRYL